MKTESIIVVLGLDADKKPRAAKFDVADEKSVRKAAAAQGLKIGRPKTDEATELALRLVDGKIYSSGKGLMPLVSAETFDRLLKLLEIEDPKADAVTAKSATTPKGGLPAANGNSDPWLKIAVGSTVYCPSDGTARTRSYYECTVMEISPDGKTLTVRWTHYKEPLFNVKKSAVALLPSKS